MTLVTGFIINVVKKGIVATLGGEIGEEILDRPENPPIAALVLYCISIAAGIWFIPPKAARAVRRLRPDTNLLMVLATGGAVAIGQWFEATTIMFLFSLAEFLEAWNMARAQRAISSLMELAPATAQVIGADGIISEQRVEDVPIGATIVVRPGEKISIDSELIAGSTTVNNGSFTGESLPVEKNIGDTLFAGTVNGDGLIHCRVTKAAADSTLAVIIRKVEEAQSHRAKSDQLIERFSLYYIPLVLISSIIVMVIPPLAIRGAWYPWIYKGLELLVISCPCSLVISTPVSIVAGLTAAARAGVLIKGGVYLETAAHIKAFAFDKTGTLTTGEPEVVEIIPFNSHDQQSLLELAASLEAHSDHPLARAIQRKAKAQGLRCKPVDNFQIMKGKGAEGYIEGELYWVGSHRFLHEKVGENETAIIHDQIQRLELGGHSIAAVGSGNTIYGLLCISDSIRPESKNAIQAMKRAGIKRIAMLTGDNKGAAQSVAEAAGVDEYYAELLPDDKVKHTKQLFEEYKQVAMVGDGINDAPALASASLGIAMGAAGSDAAIETADIALINVRRSRQIGLACASCSPHCENHTQNIIFSLFLKALFVGLTFANKSTLWLALIADMGGTFLVVSNALRLVMVSKKDRNRPVSAQTHQNSTLDMQSLALGLSHTCSSECNSSTCPKKTVKAQSESNRDAILSVAPAEGETKGIAEEKKCCSKECCKKDVPKERSEESKGEIHRVIQQSTANNSCCSEKRGRQKNVLGEQRDEIRVLPTQPAHCKNCCHKGDFQTSVAQNQNEEKKGERNLAIRNQKECVLHAD